MSPWSTSSATISSIPAASASGRCWFCCRHARTAIRASCTRSLTPRISSSDRAVLVATSRPGIFVCGAAQGPKDIPDAVQQGSSAAERATALLADARGSLVAVPPVPDERDVSKEEPRIGVFVCHCGINIAGTVDVAAVAEYVRELPDVVYTTDCMFACATDQLQVRFRARNSGSVRLQVTDLAGRQLYQAPVQVEAGMFQTAIDVKAFGPGVYQLHLISPEGMVTERFVVLQR